MSNPAGIPLAARMRPATLDEFVGQAHLLGEGSVLREMIAADKLRSVLLFGPAGTGKTTIASLIAAATAAAFTQLSAVTAGVKDVRAAVTAGRERMQGTGRRTVLFIDEVHRFTKTQQDALLPGVEDGSVVFIGATTENPFFSVISPLLSRSTLFRLEPLADQDLRTIVERARTDARGLGGTIEIAEEALALLINRSEGDARVALNALEAAADRADATIELADIDDAMRQRYVRYDRAGDQHYDVISAFIKSLRGSDPDAALAWLVRMFDAGEDPRFIARRMVILASEDVGLADPHVLQIAVAAAHAVEVVGMPEAQFVLAHAAIALALAPKSNAVARGVWSAQRDLAQRGQGAVPKHLRDPSGGAGKKLGHGVGYKYPHDAPGGWVEQVYLPEGFEGRTYWDPEPDRVPDRKPGPARAEERGEGADG